MNRRKRPIADSLLQLALGLSLAIASVAVSVLAQSPPVSATPDPIADAWYKTPKYFIVIAVDKSTVPNTQLPFALADANNVVQFLQNAGYKPLGSQPITGTQADINTVLASLSQIRTLSDETNVVVYYSGHGAVDSGGQDLFLQLYGQNTFGEPFGLRFSSLLQAARGNDEYGGKLAVIIDACFSGGAANAKSISLGALGDSTVVLSSSTKVQQALDMRPSYLVSAPNLGSGMTESVPDATKRVYFQNNYAVPRTYALSAQIQADLALPAPGFLLGSGSVVLAGQVITTPTTYVSTTTKNAQLGLGGITQGYVDPTTGMLATRQAQTSGVFPANCLPLFESTTDSVGLIRSLADFRPSYI